jgi:hypothetical protein
MLEGSSSDLRPHVGHEVEVRGKIESSSSGTSGTPSTGSTGSTAGTGTTSSASGQRLRVESVKMVAATCSSSN